MDSKKFKRQIVFGVRFPEDFRNKILQSKEPLFDLKFFVDLLINRFPQIKQVDLPLAIELSNERGFININWMDALKFGELLYEDDPKNEVAWESFFDILSKILLKLDISNIEEFGFKQIHVVPKIKYLEDDQKKFIEYLKDIHIYDNKIKHQLFSRITKYEKNNKQCVLRMEPLIEDNNYYYLDYDVEFKMKLPLDNLKEIINQEIKSMNNIIFNLNKK